jgi:hypothetical protein
MAFFGALADSKKFDVAIGTFAKNIVGEAIANRDSFLYHETEGFYTGLMGYHKPISQALFGNWDLVEEVRSLLDPDYKLRSEWDAEQWEAYCRAVKMALHAYLSKRPLVHASSLALAISHIKNAVSDTYKLNDASIPDWRDDTYHRLRVVVDFFQDAMKELDETGVPDHFIKRHNPGFRLDGNVLDHLADAIAETVIGAAAVRSPVETSWWVQHNAVWAPLFEMRDGRVTRVVQFKVRRLIYNDITRLREFPNYKGGKILGFCLNVLGIEERRGSIFVANWPLQRAVLEWTRCNLAWLYSQHPALVEACLVDNMKYEPEKRRVVKTYRAQGLQREPRFEYLVVRELTKDVRNQ